MSNHDSNSQESHQAYKTGYRSGLKGHSLSHIPSQIRGNTHLRSLYDQGWQDAQQEMKAGDQYHKSNYIRHRVTWIIMTALAGIITAYLIIQNSPETLTKLDANQSTTLKATPSTQPSQAQPDWESDDKSTLSLLSDQERRSLSVIQQTQEIIPKQPVKTPNQELKVKLYNSHNKQQYFESGAHLPKYVRQLIFEVDTTSFNQPMPLTIRWLWKRQLMQSKTWSANQSIIQSKQPLFSAQQGVWDIEILDPYGEVIYLYEFSYVQ